MWLKMKNDIVIRNATVSYQTHIALHNISLSIASGSFSAVIGPNGAGKTTLLTLINGLGTLMAGSVVVGGVPLKPRTVRAIRLMCGYVPQHSDIDPRMPVSVGESIAMGRYGKCGLFRRMKRKDIDLVNKAIKMVGLEKLMERPIGQVSGGERQKAALARAMVHEPSILLLDEPTANLDPNARVEIMHIVERYYTTTGCTVVMVTHSLDHVPRSCNHAVFTKNARIVASGDLDTICTDDALSELYDCPMLLRCRGEYRFAVPDMKAGGATDV
jgi:ABC-type cobalamin/Fe3+-siderophores transport system ATPase subunit